MVLEVGLCRTLVFAGVWGVLGCFFRISLKYNFVGLYFQWLFCTDGIVRVRLILEGGVGSSFECVGVARELTLVKFFSSDCGGTMPYIWVDWTLTILFILYPQNYYFLFIFLLDERG